MRGPLGGHTGISVSSGKGVNMLCWQCGQHEALEEEGSPITFIFGTEVAGCLCRSCATERQALWEASLQELRRTEGESVRGQ
jgi:hypothetical protein